jgi:hypothetical protein
MICFLTNHRGIKTYKENNYFIVVYALDVSTNADASFNYLLLDIDIRSIVKKFPAKRGKY